MASLPDEICDLIYADPPFNTKRRIVHKTSGVSFNDRFEPNGEGYLAFLEPRIRQMHRLLKTHGSIYVHVDWRCSHHVRLMMERIFGVENLLNEIIWSYRSGGRPGSWFMRKHDTIFLFVKNKGLHRFNRLRDGEYRTRDLVHDENGRPFKKTRKGRIYFNEQGPAMADVWELPILSTVSSERVNYPSQKPEALLERIVRASSQPGDVVGDFFCGSGTTLVCAKRLGRRFLGCDQNEAAVHLTRRRLASIDLQTDSTPKEPAITTDKAFTGVED